MSNRNSCKCDRHEMKIFSRTRREELDDCTLYKLGPWRRFVCDFDLLEENLSQEGCQSDKQNLEELSFRETYNLEKALETLCLTIQNLKTCSKLMPLDLEMWPLNCK